MASFQTTMTKERYKHRRTYSNATDQNVKTFDTAGGHKNFLYGLRNCQIKYIPAMNQRTNPNMVIHTTEPVNRFEREFKKRDIGFTNRSGFNQAYDVAEHTKPVFHTNRNSLRQLAEYTSQRSNSKLESQFIDTFNTTYNFPSPSFKLRQFTDNVRAAPLPFDRPPYGNILEQYGDSAPGGGAHGLIGLRGPAAALGLARTLNQSLESIQSEVSKERTTD